MVRMGKRKNIFQGLKRGRRFKTDNQCGWELSVTGGKGLKMRGGSGRVSRAQKEYFVVVLEATEGFLLLLFGETYSSVWGLLTPGSVLKAGSRDHMVYWGSNLAHLL